MTREEFEQRLAAGESMEDLIREAQLRALAEQAAIRQRPLEGNLGAGLTPNGLSPTGGRPHG